MKTKQKKQTKQTLPLIIIAVLLLGAIIGAITWYTVSQKKEAAITNYEECAAAGYPIMDSYPEQCAVPGKKSFTRVLPSEQSISVEGEIICLLHKDTDGPQTLECALGLKTNDGKYYGIGTDPYDSSLSETGRQVRITGTLKADMNSKYRSEGTITVTSRTFLD